MGLNFWHFNPWGLNFRPSRSNGKKQVLSFYWITQTFLKKRILVKSRIECIKSSPLLLLIKHSSTMDGYHSSSDDSSDWCCWSLLLLRLSLLRCSSRDDIVLMFVVISTKNCCSLLYYARLMDTGRASWKRQWTDESTGVLTSPLRRMRCGVDMVVHSYMCVWHTPLHWRAEFVPRKRG